MLILGFSGEREVFPVALVFRTDPPFPSRPPRPTRLAGGRTSANPVP